MSDINRYEFRGRLQVGEDVVGAVFLDRVTQFYCYVLASEEQLECPESCLKFGAYNSESEAREGLWNCVSLLYQG